MALRNRRFLNHRFSSFLGKSDDRQLATITILSNTKANANYHACFPSASAGFPAIRWNLGCMASQLIENFEPLLFTHILNGDKPQQIFCIENLSNT